MSIISPITSPGHRVPRSLACRTQSAGHDAFIPPPAQIDNGDEARYADKSGTYTKGILQTGVGLVDLAAYETFIKALKSGDPTDFEKIVLGGPRTLNGPQGGLAFGLACLDSSQFAVAPAPVLAGEEYAAELVEMYWASLLRDVPFTQYSSDPVAVNAATELSSLTSYKGPRDASNKVTPNLLFRGTFTGDTIGPYMSQFLLQDTTLGALPITQKYVTFKKGVDYMLDKNTFQQVQNGIATGLMLQRDAPLFLHDGRGLAAYTHEDVLYQAYFTAYLVLNTINGGKPAPLNPGNPYNTSKTQNGFGTLGQPDIAATLTTVAREALNAVWYQKWYVHLRHRPESGGAIVYLMQIGEGNQIQGHVSGTVLSSKAVQSAFATNNSYFLSQTFPEGSPTHPAYPTGHGAVAGACITALKFFFDGDFVLPNPKMSSNDGMMLNNYTGPDAHMLTVNGELHKLAHNISYGHGIHAAIHWRSDTETSIQLGEAVALSYLQDLAHTYNEKFTVKLTKLDGTIATISNQ